MTSDTDTESVEDETEYSDPRFDAIFDKIVSKELEENDPDIMFQDGRYYLGMSTINQEPNHYHLVASTISAKQWFSYSCEDTDEYLRQYSMIELDNEASLEIMKVHEQPDNSLGVVLKTHWIRLVQRAWRNVLGRRDQVTTSFYAKQDPRYCYQLKGMLCGLAK
jgi:hypothetical protein